MQSRSSRPLSNACIPIQPSSATLKMLPALFPVWFPLLQGTKDEIHAPSSCLSMVLIIAVREKLSLSFSALHSSKVGSWHSPPLQNLGFCKARKPVFISGIAAFLSWMKCPFPAKLHMCSVASDRDLSSLPTWPAFSHQMPVPTLCKNFCDLTYLCMKEVVNS